MKYPLKICPKCHKYCDEYSKLRRSADEVCHCKED